jgi:ubiquinone/menaquinone biosynthesis C-methylase UbiE
MFKDLFSRQASTYAASRPDYPAALIEFVALSSPRRRVAWDCATGNGQAATALAAYFERVVGSDASWQQVSHARAAEGVSYVVATAEASGLASGSVDLVTVAQALHWFDRDRFYAEARRVLAPEGAIAVWSYDDPRVADDPALDAALMHFNKGVLGSYWPPDRGLVGTGYLALPFPFDERPSPAFTMVRDWTRDELAAYTRTWSSRMRYLERHKVDPVDAFEKGELSRLWPDPRETHRIEWPVVVRVGANR